MAGLMLAVTIGLLMLAARKDFGRIFAATTKFLYLWYLSMAAIVAITVSVFVIATGTVSGILMGGILGGLVGSMTGAALAIGVILYVILAYILQIVGARLLHDSLSVDAGIPSWHTAKLVIGIVLLAVGLGLLPLS